MMDLREQIARAICGNWVVGDDRPWQQWTEEADAVIEVLAKQEPVAWANLAEGFSDEDRCVFTDEHEARRYHKSCYELVPLYAAPGAQAAVPDGWQPIETAPPDGSLVVVGWLDSEDTEDPERHDFDWMEDGVWVVHAGSVEYADMVAPPGSRKPSQRAPYTHWIDLPPIPATPKPEGK